MARTKEKVVLDVDTSDDPTISTVYMLASRLVQYKAAKDAMDEQVSKYRDSLLQEFPGLREYMPVGENTVHISGADDGRFRLTLQRTGGQARISKTKLLEHGVPATVIEQATEYSQQGETIVVVREV